MFFDFLKSKPTLKQLIPDGFVDIHSHILPGIDDGPKNVEESIELIDEMKEMGFTKIIATPHTYEGLYNNTNKSINESYDKLCKNYENNNIIDFASEYMLDNNLIKRAREKNLLCIKQNLVLVEMSYISAPNDLYEIIFQLQLNNYIPILAHPERYGFLFNNFEEYYRLKRVGVKLQLNLLSTTGYYGNEILKISDKLLKLNMIDFVGSDIHSQKHIKQFNNKVKIKNIRKLKKAIEKNTLLFK
tara:strand:+ start:288 stop:1019 length:732 start_codon:yes stop_codon:yes gene_type:complete